MKCKVGCKLRDMTKDLLIIDKTRDMTKHKPSIRQTALKTSTNLAKAMTGPH